MSSQSQRVKPNRATQVELPPIPEKLYFTIGEVGKLCALRPHVLRYWEQEFNQLRPTKRRGNRRYYQRKEVLLIRQIRDLLYNQGYTIEGARQQLSGEDKEKKQTGTQQSPQAAIESKLSIDRAVANLEKVLEGLQ